jgi:hypothetical protein
MFKHSVQSICFFQFLTVLLLLLLLLLLLP